MIVPEVPGDGDDGLRRRRQPCLALLAVVELGVVEPNSTFFRLLMLSDNRGHSQEKVVGCRAQFAVLARGLISVDAAAAGLAGGSGGDAFSGGEAFSSR